MIGFAPFNFVFLFFFLCAFFVVVVLVVLVVVLCCLNFYLGIFLLSFLNECKFLVQKFRIFPEKAAVKN